MTILDEFNKARNDPYMPDHIRSEIFSAFFKWIDDNQVDRIESVDMDKVEMDELERDLVDNNLPSLVNQYKRWVNDEYWHVMMDLDDECIIGSRFAAVMVPKRGNPIYADIISRKVDAYNESLVPQVFFDYHNRYDIHRTPVLKFTLTYHRLGTCRKDGVMCDCRKYSRYDAWKNLGYDLNLFMSNLRVYFGKIKMIHTWESHLDSYPHLNLNVLFEEDQMPVRWMYYQFKRGGAFRYIGKKSVLISRKTGRPHARGRTFENLWPHGHMDVLGVSSIDVGSNGTNFSLIHDIKYMMKDYTKYERSKKFMLQMSLLWKLRKRSYGMSLDRYDKKGNLISKSFFRVLNCMNTLSISRLDILVIANSNFAGGQNSFGWMSLGVISSCDRLYKQVDPPPDALSFEVPAELVVKDSWRYM